MVRSLPIGLFALALTACSLDKNGIGEDLSLGEVGLGDTAEPVDSVIVLVDTGTIEEDTFVPVDSTVVDSATDVFADAETSPFDSASDVAPEADASSELVAVCTVVAGGTNVNLTTEGTLGWAHYGLVDTTSFDRKIGVNPISNVAVSGGIQLHYESFETGASWSDGTPTASASSSKNGIYVSVVGAAFDFAVTGDGTLHTLRLYIRSYSTDGTVTLALSGKTVVTPLPKASGTKTYVCEVAVAWSSSLQVTVTKQAGGSLSLRSVTLQ